MEKENWGGNQLIQIHLETTIKTKVAEMARQIKIQQYHTHTHTQPFYGSVEFVQDNPGEPVPEETFTHYSHRSHQSSLSAFSI